MSLARMPSRLPPLGARMRFTASAPSAFAVCRRTFASPSNVDPAPPPKARLEPTTFDGKASPRTVHSRPKPLRGMPRALTPWEMERAAREQAAEAAEAKRAAEAAEAATLAAAAEGGGKKVAAGASGSGSGNGDGKGNGAPAAKRKPVRMQMEEHSFNGPSRPRAIYSRPSRELPSLKSKLPLYLLLAVLGLGAWGSFILYATNNERLSSSVVRQVLFQLRNSSEVRDILGEHVRFAPNWWGFGEPWISGGINLMQGRIDVKFRMRGDKEEGTVYFTSIRPQQSAPWRIVRYKVIADSGATVRLEDMVVRPVVEEGAAEAAPAAAATA